MAFSKILPNKAGLPLPCLLSLFQSTRRSSSTVAHPCAVALLLVLPLAGHLPGSTNLSRPQAAVRVAPSAAAAPANASVTIQTAPARDGQTYTLTPQRRALLNTIRYAEGTWLGGSGNGYRVLYGGKLFSGELHRHPEIVVVGNYVSAAAGAYQFLPTTWKAASRELNLPDFSPTSQDQAALHLVHRRGALQRFDREGLTSEVLARLAPEWASLPSHHGGSVYGQPVHSASALRDFYQRDLERQQRIASTRRPVTEAAAA